MWSRRGSGTDGRVKRSPPSACGASSGARWEASFRLPPWRSLLAPPCSTHSTPGPLHSVLAVRARALCRRLRRLAVQALLPRHVPHQGEARGSRGESRGRGSVFVGYDRRSRLIEAHAPQGNVGLIGSLIRTVTPRNLQMCIGATKAMTAQAVSARAFFGQRLGWRLDVFVSYTAPCRAGEQTTVASGWPGLRVLVSKGRICS